jgi:hypothetical protein
MRFETKNITPALAVEYLKRNIQTNRPLNHAHINRLADDIVAGRWLCLPHGLIFDTRGRLIDGQHRLHAIVQANRAVPMVVALDAAPTALEAIDTGTRRKLSDLATITGRVSIDVDPKRFAARAKAVHAVFENGSDRYGFTLTALDAVMAKYGADIKWSMEAYPKSSGGAGGVSRRVHSGLVMGALIVAHHVAPEATETFASRLESGIGLTADDPAYALRRLLEGTDIVGGPGSRRMPVIYATLRAAYAAIHGQKLTILKKSYFTPDNVEFAKMLRYFGVPVEAQL